jgi:hypothetical protein
MIKHFLSIAFFAGAAFAQQNSTPAKPEPPKVEAPKATPLTAEEKLQIREFQLQMSDTKSFIDVQIPKAKADAEKALSDIQDKINKFVADAQVKHAATVMRLDKDLNWVSPTPEKK